MKTLLAVGCGVLLPAAAFAQSITVVVQQLPPTGELVPASNASVVASQSPHRQSGGSHAPVDAQRMGDSQNIYVLTPAGLGSPIDVTVFATGHHPWVVRDLYVTRRDQLIGVQLFHYDYPIRAPECFALKTQYESLFRKEQQLAPDVDRAEIEHRARLKYADGLLALPNPQRQDLQPQHRAMLEAMNEVDYEDLEGMIDGLFNLYAMDGFERYAPSVWRTTYVDSSGREIDSEVRLIGTQGTYRTDDDQIHRLEGIDVIESEDDTTILGKWRFSPGTARESEGTFHWRVSESGDAFDGTWRREDDSEERSWSGTLLRGPDDGLEGLEPEPAPPDDV